MGTRLISFTHTSTRGATNRFVAVEVQKVELQKGTDERDDRDDHDGRYR